MNIPEKIFVHEASAPELTENLPYHICYIRKDIVDDMLKNAYFAGKEKLREELLKWAKEERKKCESKDSELWQRLNTLTDVIITIKKK